MGCVLGQRSGRSRLRAFAERAQHLPAGLTGNGSASLSPPRGRAVEMWGAQQSWLLDRSAGGVLSAARTMQARSPVFAC